MKKAVKAVILSFVLVATSQTGLQAQEQPAAEHHFGHEREHGGPGKGEGFHLFPRNAEEQLNLTADQRKQISDLEAEVKAKMEKILTPEQLEKLKQMRPPHRPADGSGNKGESGSNAES